MEVGGQSPFPKPLEHGGKAASYINPDVIMKNIYYHLLTDYVVIKTPNEGKSRGFGFVCFENESDLEDVMRVKQHSIDNRNSILLCFMLIFKGSGSKMPLCTQWESIHHYGV